MHIRIATRLDQDDIRQVHSAAFSEGERDLVSALAINLLAEETEPATMSWVAETEEAVVGHVAVSPVAIATDEHWQGYILAPLGVKPDCQNRGIGTKLVETGMQQLARMGIDMVFVYGDPSYYGRFGFTSDGAAGYIPPYELEYPFGWQGHAFKPQGHEEYPRPITCVSSLADSVLW